MGGALWEVQDGGAWDGRRMMEGEEWEGAGYGGAGWETMDKRCGMGSAVWQVQCGRYRM